MRGRFNASRSLTAFSVAAGLHGAIGMVLLSVDVSGMFSRQQSIIEMNVEEKAPPPPLPDPPEPEKKPEADKKPVEEPKRPPRVVVVRRPTPKPPIAAPVPEQPPAPPPPNQETPPAAKDTQPAAPIFGVTMDSVVNGGPGIAVPIGNTTMTKDRTRADPRDVKPYASAGTRPFVPIAEVYVAKMPQQLNDVNDPDRYPPEARQMGIEGKVKLRLELNERGEVVKVRVLEPGGYGFDEVAAADARKLRFSPARTSDGRAVPYQITYTWRFELPQ